MLIVFDLDDTLIETSKCLTPHYLQKAFEAFKNRFPNRRWTLEDLQRLEEMNQKNFSAKKALWEFIQEKKIDCTKETYIDLLADLDRDMMVVRQIEVVPGALEVLQRLSKEHILALVTRGYEPLQREKMKKAGVEAEKFGKIVAGETLDKKRGYLEVIQTFSVDPSSCLVCADRVEVDLSPAKELGMTTVHLVNGRGFREKHIDLHVDYRIDTLTDLLRVVEKVRRGPSHGSSCE